jgi:uncharacterized protein
MDVTPQIAAGRQIIQAYGAGGFRIAGTRHDGSVLVFPERTLPWAANAFADATAEGLAAVAVAEPKIELLLIGTGPRMMPIPAALRAHFRALGIMLDAMDTGAACRTYNVLMAEERRVAAALIALT